MVPSLQDDTGEVTLTGGNHQIRRLISGICCKNDLCSLCIPIALGFRGLEYEFHNYVKETFESETFSVEDYVTTCRRLLLAGPLPPRAAPSPAVNLPSISIQRHLTHERLVRISPSEYHPGVAYNGSDGTIPEGKHVVKHFGRATSNILNFSLLQLFMNVGCEYEEEFLPIYCTQPNINSRPTDHKHILRRGEQDPADPSKPGTMETVQGKSKFASLNTGSLYIMPYEIDGDMDARAEIDNRSAMVTPFLTSIGTNIKLAGEPAARRLSYRPAVMFFRLITGIEPDYYFEERLNDIDESMRASVLFMKTLEHMAVQYHHLKSVDDYWQLYQVLKGLVTTQRPVIVRDKNDEIQSKFEGSLLNPSLKDPTTLRELLFRIKLYLQMVTPIRIGCMDGLRRMSGAIYATLQRMPPISIPEVSKDARDGTLYSETVPDLNILAEMVTTVFVAPIVTMKGTQSAYLTKTEMELSRRYSSYIQMAVSHVTTNDFKHFLLMLIERIVRDPSITDMFQPGEMAKQSCSTVDVTDDNKKNREQFELQVGWIVNQLVQEQTSLCIRQMMDATISNATSARKGSEQQEGEQRQESPAERKLYYAAHVRAYCRDKLYTPIFSRNLSSVKGARDPLVIIFLFTNFGYTGGVDCQETAMGIYKLEQLIRKATTEGVQVGVYETFVDDFEKDMDGKEVGKEDGWLPRVSHGPCIFISGLV